MILRRVARHAGGGHWLRVALRHGMVDGRCLPLSWGALIIAPLFRSVAENFPDLRLAYTD